jgi:hypothetical protein
MIRDQIITMREAKKIIFPHLTKDNKWRNTFLSVNGVNPVGYRQYCPPNGTSVYAVYSRAAVLRLRDKLKERMKNEVKVYAKRNINIKGS